MFELYPDQKELVDKLRAAIAGGSKAPLVVLPTGGGKTVIFSWLAKQMRARAKRVQILSHRQELVDQITGTLNKFGVEHTLCQAKMHYNPYEPVCNSSVFTVARRLDKVQVPNVTIVDEAHHAVAGSVWGNTLDFWDEWGDGHLKIGFTATPERLDGTGLSGTFDSLVEGLTTSELISMGRLSDYKLFAPPGRLDTSQLHMRAGDYKRDEAEAMMSKPKIHGGVLSHYRKLLDGKPSVVFCVSRKHAAVMAEDFRAQGYKAAAIDGAMKPKERKQVNDDFAQGKLNVMTSCDLISEGYDVPGMHGAILARPTMSLALYLQQVGRALRKADGKEHAFILDHVGNSARHGLPDTPREWSLDGREKRKRKEVERDIQIKVCESCGAVSDHTAIKCRECGEAFPIKRRSIEEVEGELEEVDKARAAAEFKRARASAGDIESLVEIGKMRGMKNPHGWARHVMEARQKKRRKQWAR